MATQSCLTGELFSSLYYVRVAEDESCCMWVYRQVALSSEPKGTKETARETWNMRSMKSQSDPVERSGVSLLFTRGRVNVYELPVYSYCSVSLRC
jgi:hypothetical protein